MLNCFLDNPNFLYFYKDKNLPTYVLEYSSTKKIFKILNYIWEQKELGW